jgi:hypothetical protein
MDVGSEELFGDKSNAKNFGPSLKTKVGQKGKTLYSKRGNNVQSGTRQHNAHMFDHFKNIDCSEEWQKVILL